MTTDIDSAGSIRITHFTDNGTRKVEFTASEITSMPGLILIIIKITKGAQQVRHDVFAVPIEKFEWVLQSYKIEH